jgi:hypothetical protein
MAYQTSTDRRRRFAAKLASLLDPGSNAGSLAAIIDALPALSDLPESAFALRNADAIAQKCSALPSARELRELLTGGAQRPVRDVTPPPEWLTDRVMEQCGGQPGPFLHQWFDGHGIEDHRLANANHHAQVRADWADAGKVLRSVRAILDPPHPQAKFLLGMLSSLVERHAPANASLVPLELVSEQDPKSHDRVSSEFVPVAPAPKPLASEQLAESYKQLGIRGPR